MPVAGKESEKSIFKGIHYLLVILLLSTWELQSLTLTLCFHKEMGQHFSQFLRCLLSTAQKATCQRNDISFYNWWIYLRVLCCENPFSAENFKISFLLQLHEPGDAASLKKLFLNCSSSNTILPGGKMTSEPFPSSTFSRTSSPSSSSPASSCSSISVA